MTDAAPVSLAPNIENHSLRIAGAFASGTPTHFNNAPGFDNSQSSADVGSMRTASYINHNGVYVSGNYKKRKAKHKRWPYTIVALHPKGTRTRAHFKAHNLM